MFGGRHAEHPVPVASSSVSNVASFTSTSAPARSFGSTGAQNSSCIPIADHVCETSGGDCDRAVADHDGASVFMPRIMPP